MKVYVVVDDVWFEDMKVFSNKDEAENYMLNDIFKRYHIEAIPSRKRVKAYVQKEGTYKALSLIEKEIK